MLVIDCTKGEFCQVLLEWQVLQLRCGHSGFVHGMLHHENLHGAAPSQKQKAALARNGRRVLQVEVAIHRLSELPTGETGHVEEGVPELFPDVKSELLALGAKKLLFEGLELLLALDLPQLSQMVGHLLFEVGHLL